MTEGMAVPGPDIAIACCACTFGTTGIILNGFLLYLAAIRNKNLGKKDFIIFVMNRTAIDFVYSISIAFFQPFGILAPHFTPHSCEIAGFLDVSMACASVAAEAILACNRYVSVCHRSMYDRIYKNLIHSWAICAGVWILGVCSAVPHLAYGSLGRVTGVLCAVRFEKDALVITLISNYILVCVSLTLVGYFNYNIFTRIRRYRNQKLDSRIKSKLHKDAEVAKFIFISATVPLVLQTPATIGLFLRMYHVSAVTDWTVFVVTAMFAVCPALNPIISAMMVQPLKREWRRMIGMTTGGESTVDAIRPMAVINVTPKNVINRNI